MAFYKLQKNVFDGNLIPYWLRFLSIGYGIAVLLPLHSERLAKNEA